MRSARTFGAFLLAVVVTVMLSQSPAWAQFTSQIEGTVMDSTHAVIPNATLTLVNTATGVALTAQSSNTGYFRFPALAAANFRLTAEAPGFTKREISDLTLEGGQTRTLNIELQVGATGNTVTVTAESAAVELSAARVSSVVEQRQFTELPVLGRNMFGLIALAPGVTGTTGLPDVFGSEQQVNVNAAGMRGEQNGYSVDSATVTSMVRHGRVNLQPNAESIQEMRVSVNDFSAARGNDAGATVDVVTKSGTNQWHGSASWFHWNNHMFARNIFQKTLPVFRRNEGAASLGGPIVKNRTFFFLSYGFLNQSSAATNTSVAETPEFVNFVSSNFPNNKSSFLLENFHPSIVPVSNFRTAGQYAGVNCATSPANINTPIGVLPCNMPLTGEGVTSYTSPRTGYQWNTRIDHVLTDKDRLYFNLYRNAEHGRFGSSTRPDFNVDFPILNWYGNANWTRTFSPTVVNEFTMNAVRVHGEIRCGNQCALPSGINITGAMTGFGIGGPTPFIQNNFYWRDKLSLIRGNHTVNLGFTFSKLQSNWKPTASYQRPNFTFNNIWDFVLDQPFSEGNIGMNPNDGSVYADDVGERQQVIEAYAEDSWKIKPNLTVTLGMRWETGGKVGQSTLGNNVEWQGGTDLRSMIANGKDVTKYYVFDSADLNNFAPRIGFAWDPFKKGTTSIRGGFGVFYDVIPSQLWGGQHFTPPLYMIISASPQTAPLLPNYAFGSSNDNPYNFPRPLGLQNAIGLDSRNGSTFARANIVWTDPNLRNSYTYSYSLGVQQSLNSNTTFEANYIGNMGRKIYGKANLNRFAGDLLDNGLLNRLNPSFGAISYAQANLTSNYNGFSLALRQRYSHGLLYQVAYTNGKVIDYGGSFSGGSVNPVDAYDWTTQRGLADQQVAQKLALSAVWEIPSPKFSKALQAVVGGWQLSGTAIFQSGQPYTVFCGTPFRAIKNGSGQIIGNSGCDWNADGENNDRPMAPNFSPHDVSNRSQADMLAGIFTAADFPRPGLGQIGTLGRNTYFNPGVRDINMSIARNFGLPWFSGERSNLQVRLDAFNAFNVTNLGDVNRDMASSNFGRVTSARDARRFQAGLRLSF